MSHQPVVTGGTARLERLADRTNVDFDELVRDVIGSLEQLQAEEGTVNAGSRRVPLAKITLPFAEELQLHNAGGLGESGYNARLSAVMTDAYMPDRWDQSLVASGSFCAPASPSYEVSPQIAGTQRAIRSGLPAFLADRGQVIVAIPPGINNVTSSTAQVAGSAISIWTSAVDLSPGGTVKPVQTPPCPSTVTVQTQAIVEQLQFGNFASRAWPEWVRTIMANTSAAWARAAENQLLGQMFTNSTKLTTTQTLGASREFFGFLRQASAQLRNRQRMPGDAVLQCAIPRWFVDFAAADIHHQHPGDGLDSLGVTEADVRGWFAAANVSPIFYDDTPIGAGTTNMLFGDQTNNADLANFPPGPATTSARVTWFLFPAGTFAVADGGTLELGIIRDVSTNNTNDYRYFSESWEAILPRVVESLAVTSTLCVTGAGAIDVASTNYCAAS
jgi:hypothetical protein